MINEQNNAINYINESNPAATLATPQASPSAELQAPTSSTATTSAAATAPETPHKRRVRYKGTHPRKFEEKYKEADPERYADVIEKVIRKGSTPAGMHLSIMVDEILDVLQIKPGQLGLDATLGYGGHTSAMLARLEGKGHMYALDVDPIEIEKTKKRLLERGFDEDILTICKMNFANIDQVAVLASGEWKDRTLSSSAQAISVHASATTASSAFGPFDFVLADLGVSSMQIDNPSRGFSFKIDGPLDLRLDPEHGDSAAERLHQLSREEFEGMLIDNSDEPFAEEIARVVFGKMRKGAAMDSTTELREAVEEAIRQVPDRKMEKYMAERGQTGKASSAVREDIVKKSCARVFQALRIDVNSEFEVLYRFLEKLPHILAPGGKAAILTFHSGEDRLVKQFFKLGRKEGLYSEISEEVIRPSAQECHRNPRAKSTKLRYAVRNTKSLEEWS